MIAGPHRAGAAESRHLLQLGHAGSQPEGRRGGEPAQLRPAAAEIHQHQVNWGHLNTLLNMILWPAEIHNAALVGIRLNINIYVALKQGLGLDKIEDKTESGFWKM